MSDQIENLKILHENIRKYFEEVTYGRQARITDKAFKFLTVYTFSLAAVPSFVKTVLDFITQLTSGYSSGVFWSAAVVLIALLSLTLLIVALVFMLRVVHVQPHSAFDFEEPLDTVWENQDFPQEVLLYSVSKKLIEATKDNMPVDDERSKRMRLSYTLFYYAIATGVMVYVASKLYLYFTHA